MSIEEKNNNFQIQATEFYIEELERKIEKEKEKLEYLYNKSF
jgi:hypothetical protein